MLGVFQKCNKLGETFHTCVKYWEMALENIFRRLINAEKWFQKCKCIKYFILAI